MKRHNRRPKHHLLRQRPRQELLPPSPRRKDISQIILPISPPPHEYKILQNRSRKQRHHQFHRVPNSTQGLRIREGEAEDVEDGVPGFGRGGEEGVEDSGGDCGDEEGGGDGETDADGDDGWVVGVYCSRGAG